MPFSFPYFKSEIKEWFKNNVPTTKRILDVGPGEGTYAQLLKGMGYRIDAVEIWLPYVKEYNLRELYDNVYVGDILEFNPKDYDFIILGDVLEHIAEEDAINFINNLESLCKEYLVAVPYMMEQGVHNNNIYETHLQPDLTKDNVLVRYPSLKPIHANEYYGYYTHMNTKVEKMYVLYANAPYYDTLCACVDSIKAVSDIPIRVYMLSCDKKVPGATTIRWDCDIEDVPKDIFIDRMDSSIYKLLIQRPAIIKHALLTGAETVAYIDSDSVATPNIDRMFDMYPPKTSYPYFVEGVYDWLQFNDRGGAMTRDDLHQTLEAPACELFNVDQNVREKYRQTGYFVAGQWTINFLNEWIWMCNHPDILSNPQYYAVYHEETIANVLLWKYNIQTGLPLMYVNGSLGRVKDICEGKTTHDASWYKKPEKDEDILFYHGEKHPFIMKKMSEEMQIKTGSNVLFIAPHLSTGGMPAFLLKRIEALINYSNANIFVIEYACYSLEYVVQRNKIIELVGKDNFRTLNKDKMELFKYIDEFKPDIIHLDEMSERMDPKMVKQLYDNERSYRIIETCHDISFDAYKEKTFNPDAFAFCSPYHLRTFSTVPSAKEVIQFPINNNYVDFNIKREVRKNLKLDAHKYHVVNIGLWTQGKNQGEGIKVARQLPEIEFHFIGNQAGNFESYWVPLMENIPDNVHVYGERDDAIDFLKAADLLMFNSTWECNPLVIREAISLGVPIISRNLPQYEDMFTPYITVLDPEKLSTQISNLIKFTPIPYTIPEDNTDVNFATNHVKLYEKVLKYPPTLQNDEDRFKIIQHFVNGPFMEIQGNSKSDFKIQFFDENNNLEYENTIKANHWVKLNRQYYTKWHVKVFKDDEIVYENSMNLRNRRVYVSFDSKSLGDTIAWLPYIEQFRQEHKCEMIVSTFKNFLFEGKYPDIKFIKPGESVGNLYAMYIIGWFYNKDMEPILPNTIPLQQTASNILGLKYEELIPEINYTPSKNPYGKYIVIATNSTAQCKFWTKEGWQQLITYLTTKGYQVINLSQERNHFEGASQIREDMPMSTIINIIHHSEMLIGLSSGLSWLAWALKKHVVMIANFTEKEHEFNINTTRIVNKNVCHGCWNKPQHKFDKGNWNWCPEQKNFECHTSITATMVIKQIKHLLK